MAGKKAVGKAKKTIKINKSLTGKKNRKARKESYSIYIFKVLKQVS